MNPLTLAYLGDAIYEVYIRENLINNNIVYVKDLQDKAICYVSAKGQAKVLKRLCDDDLLKEDEKDIMMRARNYKSTHHPKNCDIVTYKYSTAFEAIIGYLYMKKDIKRIEEILTYVFDEMGGD